MAELEFAGVKFKGGKIFVVLTALSTLGGATWAAFEFYKDYMDMKQVVQNIDTKAIAARNNEIEIKLDEAIGYTRDIKNDLKDDIGRIDIGLDKLKGKVEVSKEHVESEVENFENKTRTLLDLAERDLKEAQKELEQMAKDIANELEKIRDTMGEIRSETGETLRDVESNMRDSEKDTRDTMKNTRKDIEERMDRLEKDLKERIEEALDNPLNDT
jgi:methyl-accepting chemotaxis protein